MVYYITRLDDVIRKVLKIKFYFFKMELPKIGISILKYRIFRNSMLKTGNGLILYKDRAFSPLKSLKIPFSVNNEENQEYAVFI